MVSKKEKNENPDQKLAAKYKPPTRLMIKFGKAVQVLALATLTLSAVVAITEKFNENMESHPPEQDVINEMYKSNLSL